MFPSSAEQIQARSWPSPYPVRLPEVNHDSQPTTAASAAAGIHARRQPLSQEPVRAAE